MNRYGLAGFQWMYLRLKSFQRFTETWALLERCAAAGLFQSRGEGGIFAPTAPGEGRPLRVVSPTYYCCLPDARCVLLLVSNFVLLLLKDHDCLCS